MDDVQTHCRRPVHPRTQGLRSPRAAVGKRQACAVRDDDARYENDDWSHSNRRPYVVTLAGL